MSFNFVLEAQAIAVLWPAGALDSSSYQRLIADARAARAAGAPGYLLKGALKAEILRAIRGVASSEAIFGPAIAQRLIHYFAGLPQVAPPQLFPELTDREREILALIAQHRTNSEIADRLSIAPKTVRNHVSNIFSKLQVVDRAQAIMRARDAGLGQERP